VYTVQVLQSGVVVTDVLNSTLQLALVEETIAYIAYLEGILQQQDKQVRKLTLSLPTKPPFS